MDNLDEIYKFLETYNLPKLNQEESENQNRPIITNEIKAVIKNLPSNKSPGSDCFTGEFYQTLKELTPIFVKPLEKSLAKEERLPRSFHEASIFLIPKQIQTLQRKKIIGQYP